MAWSQIHQVRCMEPIEESDLKSFVSLANKVTNMNTFIESVGGDHHLVKRTVSETASMGWHMSDIGKNANNDRLF